MRSSINNGNIKSAFGENLTTSLNPIVSYSSVYNNLNSQLITRRFGSGSNITSSDGLVTLSIDGTLNTYAMCTSKQPLIYFPGVGNAIRFTAIFNTSVTNSVQLAGIGSLFNGLFFGVNSSSGFGICRRFGGKPYIYEVAVNTAATGAGNVTVTLDGVAFAFAVTNGGGVAGYTAAQIYRATQVSNYTALTNNFWVVEEQQSIIRFISLNDKTRSGSFSVATTAGGTYTGTTIQTATNATESWTYQSAFKYDTLNSSGPSKMLIDVTKLGVYAINFQWLGGGVINFFVESPNDYSSGFTLVHSIDYANLNTTPSINNPSGQIMYYLASNGSTTAMSMKFASFAGFNEGITHFYSPKYSYSISKTTISTEKIVFMMTNRFSYNGFFNMSNIKLLNLSASSDGTKPGILKMYYISGVSNMPNTNPSNTDFLYYQNPDINNVGSVAYVDTSSSTGGLSFSVAQNIFNIYNINLGKIDNILLDLENNDMYVQPGSHLCITYQSAANSDITLNVVWLEMQ